MKQVEWKEDGTAHLVAQGTLVKVEAAGDKFLITVSDADGVRRTVEVGYGAPLLWLEVIQFTEMKMETK